MSDTTFLGVSFDAHDALAVATFWAAVLGREVAPGSTADEASVGVAGLDRGPLLMFHKVPEGKAVKNRVHLDVATPDLDRETGRLLALGARRVTRIAQGTSRWVTLADIEDNEFDLVAR